METTHNSVKVKLGIKVMKLVESLIGREVTLSFPKNGNHRNKYLVLGHEELYFVKEHFDSKYKYSEDDIITFSF